MSRSTCSPIGAERRSARQTVLIFELLVWTHSYATFPSWNCDRGAELDLETVLQNLLQAMNRSLANVILGGYSITRKEVAEQAEALEHQTTDIAGAADAITNARSVIIVPGYGLAVASAQYAIADLVKTLTSKDIKVRLAAFICCYAWLAPLFETCMGWLGGVSEVWRIRHAAS